jgi:NAD(P)-dependent dehydrogenase (short-subunit alcohol dehydrogenase family)
MPKSWFITGTSSGFGRLMTEALLARGDRVAATLRKATALDDLKERYSERLWIASLDVTNMESVREVIDSAFDAIGIIDVVVSNAGYALIGAAEELSDDQIRQQIDTNVLGSIQVIRAALPHLRRQGGGRILQISSAGGQISFPHFSLYHCSKWAIEGFAEAVAKEVLPFGIGLTIVQPGAARTGIHDSMICAPPMSDYQNSPAHVVRHGVAANVFPMPGDPIRMVQAMIDSVDVSPAPKRLVLGSDAYDMIHAALIDRLADLRGQKDVAFATDRDL